MITQDANSPSANTAETAAGDLYLVLGDQLDRHGGAIQHATPGRDAILMVESRTLLTSGPIHAQKATVFMAAMRHFARDLEAKGFTVHYLKHTDAAAADFATAAAATLKAGGYARLHLMDPTDRGVRGPVQQAAEAAGTTFVPHANDRFMTTAETFDRWAKGKKTLRMEGFYRVVRKQTGLLIQADGTPEGGQFNFDQANRERPPKDRTPPEAAGFTPDDLTEAVISEVEMFDNARGNARPFRWPVTRKQALEVLQHFLDERLADFGRYQDAMLTEQPLMWHSLLSVPLNMGLLHPGEVVDAAVAERDRRAGSDREIPLNSLEGFVRQIIGWREFMHHVDRVRGNDLRKENALDAHGGLPPAYWTGETDLHCLKTSVMHVRERGYSHHIERLMVLGNIGQLAGVHPETLLEWFMATHADALDWVMVPNVMGMSQYADGGRMTSKPYAAGANYIHKMSDACSRCRFSPKGQGEDACPLTAWYWAFIDRHDDRLAGNPRMGVIRAAWRKRSDDTKQEVRARATRTLQAFVAGKL